MKGLGIGIHHIALLSSIFSSQIFKIRYCKSRRIVLQYGGIGNMPDRNETTTIFDRYTEAFMGMICNLHAHTFRCNHASGTEREYIENAVAAGLKVYGFADHAPYPFPPEHRSGFRMRCDQQEDYVNTLLGLREEYKGIIDIKIGYEAEYYPKFFGDFLAMIRQYPIDFLILGQHYLENEMEGKYSGRTVTDEAYLSQYVDQVCEAIGTGVYTYVAHPDLVNFVGEPAFFDKHYSRLIECAKAHGIPLEINLLGVRDHRAYPHDRFFELCGEIGAPVCIGSDAHQAEVAVDAPSYDKAMEMAERFGLNVIAMPELKPVR